MSSTRSRSEGIWMGKTLSRYQRSWRKVPAATAAGRSRVRRGQHAHIHGNRLVAPDALEFALLQHAQERYLRLGREVADLVQEDGAAMGRFKAPQPPL